jgi:SAM-dependent methyltransferase
MPHPVDASLEYVDANEYFKHHDAEGKVENFRAIIAEAGRIAGRQGVLLDVGCGRGEALAAARDAGWTAVGVDTSKEFVAHARQQYGVDARVGSLSSMRFASASHTAVLLSAVLEHVFDPLDLLRECSRLLEPGGVLYIQVPNEEGLYYRLGNLYMRALGRDWVVNLSPTFSPFHVHGFSPRSAGFAVRRSGLFPVKVQTYGHRTEHYVRDVRGWFVQGADRLGALVGVGSELVVWARKPT